MFDFFSYFTDPVLRAPTIGCMAMAISSALVGTLLVLRRRSLIGEALSHAAFPGVVLGVLIVAPFASQESEAFSGVLLLSAFLFSLLGLGCIGILERRFKISSDAALCFVLAVFLGLGVLIASRIQTLQTAWYKQALVFLYGQAATMTDRYLPLYGILAILTIAIVWIAYPQIQMTLFDRQFAKLSGFRVRTIETLLTLLVALAVVIGMRSMGVVLMAGMFIAPAVGARPWCSHLRTCLLLSAFLALFSALAGNILSVEGARWLTARYPDWRFSLPTGPMILLVSAVTCFLSLLIAPRGGMFSRILKRWVFQEKITNENLLKALWKRGKGREVSFDELKKLCTRCRWHVLRLRCLGLLEKKGNFYHLTSNGWGRACRIVRLHRLWEVYLVEYMSQGVDRVHKSAEDLEHVMDEGLEKELERLLGNLTSDPHRQPIPSREEGKWE